mmetsp:Transcript_57504/g.153621  ORF Transcript_57504/g.153621 Transcript_57504/m.153621 type:complete len:217 (+) Transcript_57504:71-721(+)
MAALVAAADVLALGEPEVWEHSSELASGKKGEDEGADREATTGTQPSLEADQEEEEEEEGGEVLGRNRRRAVRKSNWNSLDTAAALPPEPCRKRLAPSRRPGPAIVRKPRAPGTKRRGPRTCTPRRSWRARRRAAAHAPASQCSLPRRPRHRRSSWGTRRARGRRRSRMAAARPRQASASPRSGCGPCTSPPGHPAHKSRRIHHPGHLWPASTRSS